MIKTYNRFLKKLVEKLDEPRLNYIDVVENLGLTPEKDIILAPDGTHWMWTNMKNLPLASSHVGFLKTLFSHYCFYR